MKIRFLGDSPAPPKKGEYMRKQDGSLYRVVSFVEDATELPKVAGVMELDPVATVPEGVHVQKLVVSEGPWRE
jgi:hypothetical protein